MKSTIVLFVLAASLFGTSESYAQNPTLTVGSKVTNKGWEFSATIKFNLGKKKIFHAGDKKIDIDELPRNASVTIETDGDMALVQSELFGRKPIRVKPKDVRVTDKRTGKSFGFTIASGESAKVWGGCIPNLPPFDIIGNQKYSPRGPGGAPLGPLDPKLKPKGK